MLEAGQTDLLHARSRWGYHAVHFAAANCNGGASLISHLLEFHMGLQRAASQSLQEQVGFVAAAILSPSSVAQPTFRNTVVLFLQGVGGTATDLNPVQQQLTSVQQQQQQQPPEAAQAMQREDDQHDADEMGSQTTQVTPACH